MFVFLFFLGQMLVNRDLPGPFQAVRREISKFVGANTVQHVGHCFSLGKCDMEQSGWQVHQQNRQR